MKSLYTVLYMPKVTLKTIAKVKKLDAGTPSCTQPPKLFSIFLMQYSIKYESISKRPKMASARYFDSLWMTFNEELQGQISACLQRTYICIILVYNFLYMRTGPKCEKWPKSDI